jgi:cytochrome oxidase Cu insertion factor (SCO1/SenC/PrrC family)
MASITAFPDSNGYTKSFSLDERTDLLNFFEEYGFVVVRNIIDSDSQIEDTIDEIWNLLRVLNPNIDKNDSSTWDDKYWPIQMGLKDGEYSN